MNNTILEKPLRAPVSLAEVKTYLRLDTAQENALVDHLIHVATRLVEDYTGRALLTQVHRLVTCFEDCRHGEIILPTAPFQELVSMPQVLVGNRAEQVRNYRLDQSRSQARVKMHNYYTDETHVRIDYRCGYGDGPETVPDPLRQAILLLIADLYENRPGEKPSLVLPGLVRALLNPYRILHVS